MVRMLLTLSGLALLLLALAACSGKPADEPPTRLEIVPIQIDEVKVAVMKSLPAQISLEVRGIIGDSCNSLNAITQTRKGNEVEVSITAVRKHGVPCMELAQLFEQTIKLDGDFPPGTYTIKVNDKVQTVTT